MSQAAEPEVLTRVEGRVGRITLNRPKALHALNVAMCQAMTEALLAWRADPAVEIVLLDHAGERGFCAGGDVRMVAQSGASNGEAAREFFHTEYRLNHLLFEYPKHTVAFIDGVVMGGGVGISRPCRFRVATERTVFAMPETSIGLFPDVGGGWYLPRMPGHIGLWLALTGARLKAADCQLVGVATDYVESARVAELKAAIIADPAATERLLTEFEADPGRPEIAAHQDEIARIFSLGSVEAIVAALEASDSAWAREQARVLASKSPQTLKVAFRQLQLGAQAASFAQNMALEYRIAARVSSLHDFQEGVRAVLVDKDNAPRWNPPTLDAVKDEALDAIFAPLPAGEEWTPLG
ncbi:enoyl-CoA hydratase/isomerase family protein [Phenylobacterium deserti]|uniref:3-hydroxyisobutyryl-CoA hydrolase n=1 Tax=Phenylobacterium deserti TaxID=1914756 RepID=A0A328AF35_9CAUL|nr:enoyl-CoA hydratase/isomerase family protein [Phenylobacterium deserti]RAK52014.1 enoyl-CoA hydratase/isomerase family protein [Phenylobacterium deserti]